MRNLIIPGRTVRNKIKLAKDMSKTPIESEELLYALMKQLRCDKHHQYVILGYPVDVYIEKLGVIIDIIDSIHPIENTLLINPIKDNPLKILEKNTLLNIIEKEKNLKIFRVKENEIKDKNYCEDLLQKLQDILLKYLLRNKAKKIKSNSIIIAEKIKIKAREYEDTFIKMSKMPSKNFIKLRSGVQLG